jgi:hypothetical protein
MFLVNWGAREGDVTPDGPHGLVLLASSLNREDMVRREFPTQGADIVVIDPQLYLASGLDPEDCGGACGRLVTHAWFTDGTTDFDSSAMDRRTWARQVRDGAAELWDPLPGDEAGVRRRAVACIQFQLSQGVSHLVLAAPGCEDPTSDFQEQLAWTRIGLEAAANCDAPILATVCLSQSCLGLRPPEQNPLVQIVADNLTAVEGLSGVYLVVNTTGSDDVRVKDLWAAEALLYLCREISRVAGMQVIVNFADLLGMACLGAGATAFATGYAANRKRLNAADLVDRSGGWSLPKFYSHRTICDYYPERDLSRIRDAGLLRLLASDETVPSQDLLGALRAGDPVSALPAWRESRNNVTAARLHLIARVSAATRGLPTDLNDRRGAILEWLEDAERDGGYLEARFREARLNTDFGHLGVWRAAFQRIVCASS